MKLVALARPAAEPCDRPLSRASSGGPARRLRAEGRARSPCVGICAPGRHRAASIAEMLRVAGIAARAVPPEHLASAIRERLVAAVVLTEEALSGTAAALSEVLAAQPLWSDFPLVLLASQRGGVTLDAAAVAAFGNVAIVERPVRRTSLVAAASAALRMRARQTMWGEHLRAREDAEAHARDLAEELAERAAELEVTNDLLRAEVEYRSRAEARLRRADARLRHLQNELIQVSRLSAMGAMASTLAHELNQPLTIVSNYVRGCRRLVAEVPGAPLEPLRTALAAAEAGALHAGEIVRGFREMVAGGGLRTRRESLSGLIEEACVIGLVDARLGGIEASFAFDPAAPEVLVDRVQIQQVMINLIRNGVDAMEGCARRELVIATRSAADGVVEVRVSDTGAGIDPAARAHLFSAFKSFKPDGMGLGLSICRTIVEAHGGRIGVVETGVPGTTFAFTLPTVPRPREPA